MMRDIDERPYTPDEQRVADYFFNECGVGGGDDPIEALITQHRWVMRVLLPEAQAAGLGLQAALVAAREVCAEVYQVVGALTQEIEGPDRDKPLDNLLAAAEGEPIPHATLLPYPERKP